MVKLSENSRSRFIYCNRFYTNVKTGVSFVQELVLDAQRQLPFADIRVSNK